MEVRRRAYVSHPASRMFDLIEAAESYPEFLPWCASTQILQRDESVVVARIDVAWRGVKFSFVTRNPKCAPRWMTIGLEEGPFRHFAGRWELDALTDWGCRIDFALSYALASSWREALAGPVLEHVTNTLVDAFIQRADQLAAPTGNPVPAAGAVPRSPNS
jgi:ribosome-associated toxin RatA of RatAB toxin-antitoxin module